MRQYFSTFRLIGDFLLPITAHCKSDSTYPALLCGLFVAGFGSLFIYLSFLDIDQPSINTISALLSLSLLLLSGTRTWFWSGFFIGLFWFWWIGLSFLHYQMLWAIPLVILFIATVYGGIFWLIAKTATIINKSVAKQRKATLFTIHSSPFTPRALVTSFGRTLHSNHQSPRALDT